MPAYGAAGFPKALNVGDNFQLITAADAAAGNVTATAAVAIAQGGASVSTPQVTVTNSTTQTATAQVATSDATGNYLAFTDGDTGTAITIPTATARTFSCSGPLLRFSFGTAPTSGLLTISR